MFGLLKFWKWRIFHRKKQVKEEIPIPEVQPRNVRVDTVNTKPTLYPSRDIALITSVSDAKLRPINVLDDHFLEYGKKKIRIKYDRPAHILDLPLHELLPTRKQRIIAKFAGIPKFQTFRCYTFQNEAEITHDMNQDHYSEKQKMRFEKLIQLESVAVKAAIASNIMAGLKDKSVWWEKLGPLLILAVVVAFFLFAFQVQPNM